MQAIEQLKATVWALAFWAINLARDSGAHLAWRWCLFDPQALLLLWLGDGDRIAALICLSLSSLSLSLSETEQTLCLAVHLYVLID